MKVVHQIKDNTDNTSCKVSRMEMNNKEPYLAEKYPIVGDYLLYKYCQRVGNVIDEEVLL